GGWLIGISSWRVIFFLNVPIAIATVAIAVVFMPRATQSRKDVPIDYAGATLCALGLGGIVFALSEQPRRGWSDAAVAAGLAGGAACLAAFLAWEARSLAPMLPLRLFASRNFSVTNVETLAVYGGLSAWGFFLALFLQQVAG